MMSAKRVKELVKANNKKNKTASDKEEEEHKRYMVEYRASIEKKLPKILKNIEEQIKEAISKNKSYVYLPCDDTDELSLCQADVITNALKKLGYVTELLDYRKVTTNEYDDSSTNYAINITW